MEGTIYLVGNGDQLTEMRQRPYDSESVLQTLLAKYPDLLGGEQMDSVEPRRWLLAGREVGLPSSEDSPDRWSVDHLFIDQSGIPTIVEVKRSSNTQIRREVIGQMLDYAANAVVYWPVETIRSRFESRCQTEGKAPEEVLAEQLGEETEPEAFWQSVKTNLQAGRVRLVLVADEVPDETKRVIQFLNEQMDPADVLAVEIRQYVGSELKTLVPRVLGTTGRKPPPPPGQRIDEQQFLETCGGKSRLLYQKAKELTEGRHAAGAQDFLRWRSASYTYWLAWPGKPRGECLYIGWLENCITVYKRVLREAGVAGKEFIERLKPLPAFKGRIDTQEEPFIHLTDMPEYDMDQFIDAVRELSNARAASGKPVDE